MSGKAGSKNEATTLSGNAYVKTETMEIKADSITLSGENFRYITASGTVDGKNTESKLSFTCGNMRYDRNTKIARLEDSVHMTDTENDVKAAAQIIEYNQNTEIATMQINVSIKQKNNTCTAAFAIYRKDAQTLEMTGNPKIVQGEDSFRAQEISLNLNTQEIKLDGRVSGQVSDSTSAKPDDSNPASAKSNSKNTAGDEDIYEEKTAENLEGSDKSDRDGPNASETSGNISPENGPAKSAENKSAGDEKNNGAKI